MNDPKLSFNFVLLKQTLDEINKLNPKKASQTRNIPVPIIKENKDIIILFVHHNFNNSLPSFSFPTGLKMLMCDRPIEIMTKLITKLKDQLALS